MLKLAERFDDQTSIERKAVRIRKEYEAAISKG